MATEVLDRGMQKTFAWRATDRLRRGPLRHAADARVTRLSKLSASSSM
jgi:hypothetical protein